MTSRRSSGSILAESAVEPTRSENITVTWRRSAVSEAFDSASVGGGASAARSAIASKGRFRWPREMKPSSFRSASVSLVKRAKSISFSTKRCAYCPRPSLSAVSDLLHRGSAWDYRASLARIGKFILNGYSVRVEVGTMNCEQFHSTQCAVCRAAQRETPRLTAIFAPRALNLRPSARRSTLFAVRRSDLPSRMINKEVFENELPFAALKRPGTARALNLTVRNAVNRADRGTRPKRRRTSLRLREGPLND
jgi:hypothetical protein